MAQLNRNGVNIYYETYGTGPAVLLSHGFSATSKMWKGQIEALSQSHTLIIWDMRGHGQSDSPDDPSLYSEKETVEDMAGLLDAVGTEKAVIGGLSLGGYMSLAFNLAFPERVRALMLFDTGPGFKKDDARDAWNQTAATRAKSFEEKGLDTLESGSSEMVPTNHRSAKGLALAARGILAQKDARIILSLPDIAVPTLVLAGENDKPFLAATDYMDYKIPNTTKVMIPEAGHSANIDQPQAFNDAVTGFLKNLS